jgi:hypothetical protein
MNWKTATSEQINAAIRTAKVKGRGVTVSPDWLFDMLHAMREIAKLSADTPQFSHPLHVYAAKQMRDQAMRGEWPRREA